MTRSGSVSDPSDSLRRVILVSFDIDGTLELGDPPGPVSLDVVRRAKALGCIIGSASDRTLREQREVWARAGIEPDFTSPKHQLARLREAHACARFVHIGDTLTDAHFAELAGFEFVSVVGLAPGAEILLFD